MLLERIRIDSSIACLHNKIDGSLNLLRRFDFLLADVRCYERSLRCLDLGVLGGQIIEAVADSFFTALISTGLFLIIFSNCENATKGIGNSHHTA